MKKYNFRLQFVIAIMLLIHFTSFGQHYKPVQTAGSVIHSIIAMTGSEVIPNTVDIIKEGSDSTAVKGIAVCMFATLDVLKKAVNDGCNLIVTHEPIYFNHFDDTEGFANNPVFLAKQKFIRDNHLVIWRFHDYIHSMKPDGIMSGMAWKLNWEKYATNSELIEYKIPKTTLQGLVNELKVKFPGYVFQVVGKSEMEVTGVGYAAGASGSGMHLHLLNKPEIDVVIAGEGQQWETYEYTREAVAQGYNKAVIFLGHIPSEEAGMEYCATWLKSFIKNVPITFYTCGPSYNAM